MGNPDPEDDFDELDGLVLACLERMEREGEGALDALCRERPEHAAGLRRRCGALRGSGLLDDAPFPEHLGEFRLLEVLGGGGMGIVYLARQESLGREVALKLIRPEHLFFPEARQRFRREVEAVARVQHPGIVPVYAVGEERGLPYFAMERVRGCTLAELLGALAAAHPGAPAGLAGRDLAQVLGAELAARGVADEVRAGEPLFGGGWTEACLRLAQQVAEALDHAHGHGVLHRDVKPSNVLLTAAGRTQLCDFGLSLSEGGGDITRTGTPVGTLAYMAPEQLDGRGADRRTDVYGLGVLLFELLTLEHPFEGRTAEALHRGIAAGAHDAPSARNRDVPRDVDVVCRKALDPDPERRYASAADFARDVRNVLELRPIEARPAGLALRARRWTQRHPARTVALALGGLVVVGGPAGFAIQRELASREVDAALSRTAEERSRAEQNLDRALEAVTVFLAEVGQETLAEVPGMGQARGRLLERASELVAEIHAQRTDDPELRRVRARLLSQEALVLEYLGRDQEAEAAFRRSVEALTAELEANPGERALREDLAAALGNLASVLMGQWRYDEAWDVFSRACELLPAEDPALLTASQLEACRQAHANGANLATMREDFEEAGRQVATALRYAEQLLVTEPGLRARVGLAEAVILDGDLELYAGELDEAALRYGNALELLAEVEQLDEPPRRYLLHLVHAARGAAAVESARQRYEEVERHVRRGLPPAERLQRDHPYAPEYGVALSDLHSLLAISLVARDRREEALVHFQTVLELREELLAASPDDQRVRYFHAIALSNLANWHVEAGDQGTALEIAERALSALRTVPANDPDVTEVALLVQLVRGQARLGLGQYFDPLELIELVQRDAPRDPRMHSALASTLAAGVSGVQGDPDLTSDERAALAEDYATAALDALARAIDLGYTGRERILRTREFDPLRERPEFQELLARIRP